MSKKKSSKKTSPKASKSSTKSSRKKKEHEPKKNIQVWQAATIVMAVALGLILLYNLSGIEKGNNQNENMDSKHIDQLIFIQSDGCTTACEEMEPVAREVAKNSNLEFRKITTPQEIPIPGYMVIKDKETKSLLRPLQDKATFYKEVCAVTNSSKVCKNTEELAKKAEQEAQEKQEQQLQSIPKREKPEVDLYVMSFCPYGNKAENTMQPVYEQLKDKVQFNVNYIVSAQGDQIKSLHGSTEVAQNKREVCVMKEYGMDKFFSFITYVNDNCGSKGDCWKEAAKESGLDSEAIQNCVDEEGTELMKQEARKAQDAGASGSPTMFVNGKKSQLVYNYGSPESYKKAICAGFTSVPTECKEQLQEVVSAEGSAGSC
ncbi:MAG: DsbA family protein [Nanobdellota archaeon]